MTAQKEAEYRIKTLRTKDACVIIHKPVLTEAEYDRREKQLKDALTKYGRSLQFVNN